MASIETKNLIADTFIHLCEANSVTKVSVSDVITASGRNRKTFYYHFDDRNDLIQWIFRRDLAAQLLSEVPPEQLVYHNEPNDPCRSFPYYVFVKDGIRSIDDSTFFRLFGCCLQQRRSFYAQLLDERGSSSLTQYLQDLYVPAIRNDIDFILSNRYLSQVDVDFLAEFFATGFIEWFARRCEDKTLPDLEHGMGSFGNIIHASLEHAIADQQQSRVL